MKKDWRTTKWKDFNSKTKFWFCALMFCIVALITMIVIHTTVVTIPNWVAALWMVTAVFVLYKLFPDISWAFDPSHADDDADDDADDEQ